MNTKIDQDGKLATEPCLLIADKENTPVFNFWRDDILRFEEVALDRIATEPMIALGPGNAKYLEDCERILGYKRDGKLPFTKIVMVTYKGRHLWTEETDGLVAGWVVHAKSEAEVIKSNNLFVVPLCLNQGKFGPDEDFAFVGGRKYREFGVAAQALAELGIPSVMISDRAPQENYNSVEMVRKRIPKRDYVDRMSRARIVLVPLQIRPESHGHVDVVTAILRGKPVVATKNASCDDYIMNRQTGMLVDTNSLEDWKECIWYAWQNAEELSRATRELSSKFSQDKYVGYLREMLELIRLAAGVPSKKWSMF